MQLTGTIENILEQVTRGNYTSRCLWLKTDEKYPQTLNIECGGKDLVLFDNLAVGQRVTIEINLKGRIWQDKCFNSLVAWKVTADKQSDGITPENNNTGIGF